jgi:hypothetical protein
MDARCEQCCYDAYGLVVGEEENYALHNNYALHKNDVGYGGTDGGAGG